MHRVDMSDFKGKKTALVLSGGVVKAGAWHIGVALALEELGYTLKHNNSPPSPELEVSSYIGSSAGAIISLFFAAGMKPIDITEANVTGGTEKLKPITYKDMLCLKRSMRKPPRGKGYKPFAEFPMIVRHLLQPILKVSGIFSTEGLNRYIREHVITSDRYEDYEADLFIVATQLDHSHKVIFSKFNYPSPAHDQISVYYTGMSVADSISASMSVPVIYSPYPIENPYTNRTEYYIDGEVRETLSSHIARDNNCSVMICSWTHTPYHYQEEIGSLVNYGLPAICIQSMYLMIQKKIIASRDNIRKAKDVVDTVSSYMKDNNFSNENRKQILSILERKLDYKSDAIYIDVFPRHNDYKLFLKNHFSLSPTQMSEVISCGYRRTIEAFRKYQESL